MLSLKDVQFTYVVYALDQWAGVKKGPLVFRFLLIQSFLCASASPTAGWIYLPGFEIRMNRMGLLDLVKRMRGEDGLQKLAEKTAQLCIDEVWHRVVGRIINMRILEARGYIRARGIRVIRAAVDRQISSQPALIRMQRSRLINQSVEVVIGLVMPRLAAAQQAPAALSRAA